MTGRGEGRQAGKRARRSTGGRGEGRGGEDRGKGREIDSTVKEYFFAREIEFKREIFI